MTVTHIHDIDTSQLTSDQAIWSLLVGKPVNVNIAGRNSWSIVTLAQVTESFLIFQYGDDDGQHTKMWRHDHVRSLDVCQRTWKTEGQDVANEPDSWSALFRTNMKYVPGKKVEIFGTIELDHVVIERQKRGGGVGVGVAIPVG